MIGQHITFLGSLSELDGLKGSAYVALNPQHDARRRFRIGNPALSARPTQKGIVAIGNDYEPLSTDEELQAYWRNRLPEGERKNLNVLIQAQSIGDSLDDETGYKRSSRDRPVMAVISQVGVDPWTG